jgi:hypothetical protein
MAEKVEQNKQMSLSESATFDHNNGARERLTGWGIVSKDRHERGISRKQRRLRKKNSEG